MRVVSKLFLLLFTITLFQGVSTRIHAMRLYDHVTQDQTATVYVFSKCAYTVKHPVFYCDDQEVAEMVPGHYFVLKLNPGPHVFRIGEKKPSLELNIASNQTYYLHCYYGIASVLKLMAKEKDRGEREFQNENLAPLRAASIKDKVRVVPIDTPLNYPTAENWKVTLVSAQRMETLKHFSPRGTVESRAGKNKHYLKMSLKVEYIGIEFKVTTPMISILDMSRKDKPKEYKPIKISIEGKAGEAKEKDIQVAEFFIHGVSMIFEGGVYKIEGYQGINHMMLKKGTDFGTIDFVFELPNDLSEPKLVVMGGSDPLVIEYR